MRAPVARFVGVVAAIAVALGILAWTGAAAPAVEAIPMGEGTQADGQVGYLLAIVENRGATPVRIVEAEWSSAALRDSEVLTGPEAGAPAGMEPFEPFELAGGERWVVMVRGAIDCPLPGDVVTIPMETLQITADPALGPSRALELLDPPGAGLMTRTLPCPPR